jgi:hypothetical protein
MLRLHFWLVRNKILKKQNNPLWKQTMDTGILLRISHSNSKTTNGELFHISTGISVPNMLKEITQRNKGLFGKQQVGSIPGLQTRLR